MTTDLSTQDTTREPPRQRAWAGPLALVAAVLLAVVFLFSGIAKAIEPDAAERFLGTFGFSYPAASWSVRAAVLVELVLGAWLLSGTRPRLAAAATLLLLAFFTALLAVALRGGKDTDCGCMGSALSLNGHLNLVRNWALGLVALVLLFAAPHTSSRRESL